MNVAKLAYKNLQIAKLKPKPKGGGLLARNVPERTDTENLEPNKRVLCMLRNYVRQDKD